MSKNVHIVEQILMLFFWALYKKKTLNNCIILEYIKKRTIHWNCNILQYYFYCIFYLNALVNIRDFQKHFWKTYSPQTFKKDV